jgi:hypothetical protein
VTRWRSAAAAAAVLAVVSGTTGVAAADGARSRTVFHWQDRRITESSGLADGGRVLFTINDSGDGPFVYAVDKSTGRTRVTTTYSSHGVTDVEAVARGRKGSLWTGDIGDNNDDRSTISLYHLPGMSRLPARVDATRYDLVYPGAPSDAETLLVNPRTGRAYVVTKTITGGTVYVAPARLRQGRVNRLTPVTRVPGLLTDGAFFPDGRHVLLRTYASASVYTFPGWRPLGTVRLPEQKQGEGITVGRNGAVYISTEGPYSAVQQVFLPRSLADRLPGPDVSTTAEPATGPGARDRPTVSTEEGIGVWVAGAVVLVTFAGWLAFTVLRPRRRTSR